ncbi:hypothetical protein LOC68_09155 [Blastopirellula sp. JC732]|uniref:Asl1-like glycosyl hydrolase catalytic domain-containing protein n=1 Tax=Blastopirellula sediminis TaxID=2894196 RepID=A0A9X1MK03_9BACT|nr:hypothetical protein [Blastopirellula sediminis]MCC9628563.1 hypothetical protein [Blastopirellula sediminis]
MPLPPESTLESRLFLSPRYFAAAYAFAITFASLFCSPALAESPDGDVGPWGVSSSASAFRNHTEWFPKVSTAGVTSVRLFPGWRTFQPQLDQWNWKEGDQLVESAKKNNLQLNAILMGSPPDSKYVHAFPMDDLPAWSQFVEGAVSHYKGDVRYWEVWNEGNGGFNDAHHTTVDYAKLAAATYVAAKKGNPDAQVGLTVASYDPAYLHQTILALRDAGAADHFDYLCIHPYEIAGGLRSKNGEIPFLWMNQTLRTILAESAPDKVDAPIWISEVGDKLHADGRTPTTDLDAAQSLVKMYAMAIAQGIARTQWFEAQDPYGEESGFGLINRSGEPRPAYAALKTLATQLGTKPKYLGWLALGEQGAGYGFVFAGTQANLMIAWSPVGEEQTLTFPTMVVVADPITGRLRRFEAGEKLTLTNAPLLITSLSPTLVSQAKANAAQNFPWGGDHRQAKTVRFSAGAADETAGLFPLNRDAYPTVTFADGSSGLLVQGDIGHPVSLFVHPTFASILTRDYYVRVKVRRVSAGNVGMNLLYEVADTQGGTPYRNVGTWFGVSADPGWQTGVWHVKEACFAKMWGNDITIRPEQSVPFVIGEIEVSTEPFK